MMTISPEREAFEQLEEAFIFEGYDFFAHHKHNNSCKKPALSFHQALQLPPNVVGIHLHQHAGEQINAEIIRSVGMHCGSNVVSVCVSSMALTDRLVESLLPHLCNVKYLQFDGISLGSVAARAVAVLCHNTLISLRVHGCHLITSESLGWLSGSIGHNSPRLHQLKALDVSFTNIDDRGLAYLSKGLGQIECLAMEGCSQLTFAGKETLANLRAGAFTSMRVLNLRGCSRVGDRGAVAIAQAMPGLQHLNVGCCGRITDRSAAAIGKGCTQLKSLSVEGALGITDAGLAMIANTTKLNLINITGCGISRRSLLAVIDALGYVKETTTFFGFVLRDVDARAAALSEEERSITRALQNQAAHSIQAVWKTKRRAIRQLQSLKELREHQAATQIQSFVLNRQSRRRFAEIGFRRASALSSTSIQKMIRGWLTRRRLRQLLSRYRKLTYYARLVQSRFRGKFVRSRDELVMPAILALRAARLVENRRNAATIIQCSWRNAAALARLRCLRRVFGRRRRSSVLIQRVGRSMMGRHRSIRLRLFAELHYYYRTKMATRIQCFQRQWIARRQLDMHLGLAAEKHLLRYQSARIIQAAGRGMLARQFVQKRRRAWNAAAVEIQRVFRGKQVQSWQDLKRVAVWKHVQERAEMERAKSLGAMLGYTQQSKHGEEEDKATVNMPEDGQQLLKYVFGPSFVHLRCKIYWPETGLYKAGSIADYSDRMRLWQINYDEDDNEWLDLVKDHDRVLVKEANHAQWTPFSYCRPLPLTKYLEKRKTVEPSNSTWAPKESSEKVSSDTWYCAYVARGMLDECHQTQTHAALQKLRDAHLVKALSVCIAKARFVHRGSNDGGFSEREQFEQLLQEVEEFIARLND